MYKLRNYKQLIIGLISGLTVAGLLSCMFQIQPPTITKFYAEVTISEDFDIGLYQLWDGDFDGDPWWVSGDAWLTQDTVYVCYDWPGEPKTCENVPSTIVLSADQAEIVQAFCSMIATE